MRWVVVRDPGREQALADLYLPHWAAYYEAVTAGQVQAGAPPEIVRNADHFAVGYPERPFPSRLARAPVEEIAFAETFGRPLFR